MTRRLFTQVAVASAMALAVGVVAGCSSTTNEVAPSAPASVETQDVIKGFDLPQVLATSSDGKLLYVAQNNGEVIQVSTPSYERVGSWNSGITVPLGMDVSPDGSTIYLSNRTGSTVVKKNAATGANIGSWSTGSSTSPTGIALSPDGSTIYVPQNASAGLGADKLTVRTASSGALQQTWTFSKGSRPRAAAISPNGKLAYVSMEGANRIAVLNTGDGSEAASWDLSSYGFNTPGYLALSPKGDKLYIVTVNPSAVLVLDTAKGTAIGKWADNLTSAFGIAAMNCGQTVFVSNWTEDGWVANQAQPNQCDPGKVPSAPQSVAATFNNKTNVITVTWKPPADPGSSPIVKYTATATDNNKKTPDVSCETKTGDQLTCAIQVGNPGPRYDVTVTATNSAGTGPGSPPVNVKTK